MSAVDNFTDLQLIAAVKGGDEAAFRVIYDRYNALLFTYAFRRLKSKEQAKDVVQDVFIQLWEKRDTFQLKTYLSGFLYKSVLNRVLDIWKHDKIVRKHVLSQALEIDVDTRETDFLVREKDILAIIEKEIATMPPRMKEIYEMKYRQYLSSKKIALELGISENTVATQLQRASAHLKSKLGLVVFVFHLIHR